MTMAPIPALTESQARRDRLGRLRDELRHLGVPATMIRLCGDRWLLKLTTMSILCAGAEGVYVFVTPRGQILSSAGDAQISVIARRLAGPPRP